MVDIRLSICRGRKSRTTCRTMTSARVTYRAGLWQDSPPRADGQLLGTYRRTTRIGVAQSRAAPWPLRAGAFLRTSVHRSWFYEALRAKRKAVGFAMSLR